MAAQKLESLGLLVSGIAHNFNNMMAAVIAEADVAQSELPPGSPASGNAERIISIATRAADFVSLLRAYAGSEPARPLVEVNFSEVVRDTLPLLKATVSKNIVFSAVLSEKLPPVRADLSQIRQVILNLLTNACEALPNGHGSVHVTTDLVHIESAHASGHNRDLRPGDYVQLCVRDSGCGIPVEYQSKIFDPFCTTKFRGRGLGLAAVQGIVRNLEGAIRVRSAPGKGSTFCVLCPSLIRNQNTESNRE